MNKFYGLKISRLTNGQHFAFMTAFVEEIQKIKDAPAKMKTAIDAMKAAQAEEDKYLKIAQGSPLTEKIAAADELRDSSYRKLRDIVKVWLGTANEPQAKAAAALDRVINTYRINTSAQMDEQTGLMTNMLTDISTDEMKQHIAAIGATDFVETMTKANDEVVTLLRRRDEERADRVVGAMRKARLNSDKAYNALTVSIEAFNYTAGGYDELIMRWNATVARYQEVLNRKAGSSRDNTPGGDDGSDSGDGDNGDGDTGGTPGGGDIGGGDTGEDNGSGGTGGTPGGGTGGGDIGGTPGGGDDFEE